MTFERDRFAAWEAQRLVQQAREDEAFAKNREALFDLLAAQGATHAIVQYDGGGDSGQISDRSIEGADPSLLNAKFEAAPYHDHGSSPGAGSVADALEEIAMILVTRDHAGWENNDGGEGTVTFDVVSRTIEIEHSSFYTERDTSCHTY